MSKKQYEHKVIVKDNVNHEDISICKDGNSLLFVATLRISAADALELADFIKRKFGKPSDNYRIVTKKTTKASIQKYINSLADKK